MNLLDERSLAVVVVRRVGAREVSKEAAARGAEWEGVRVAVGMAVGWEAGSEVRETVVDHRHDWDRCALCAAPEPSTATCRSTAWPLPG